MSDLVATAAGSALSELLEVSPQVDAAVILERDRGRLLASAPAASGRMADHLGTAAHGILEAAERARIELSREPVSQVEVATPGGHVFVVADATWIVAAVTDADPTVGLVFYDLKTVLRSVREARGSSTTAATATSSLAPDVVSPPPTTVAKAAAPTTDTDAATSDSAASTRWRRRKS